MNYRFLNQAIHALLAFVVLAHSAVSASAVAEQSNAQGFDQTLLWEGISFRVSSPNNSSLSPITIEMEGLELGELTVAIEADGTVTGAQVADLDINGSPELYIYTTSAGSGSYGNVIVYVVGSKNRLSVAYLSPVPEGAKSSIGYRGHDTFSIVENTLERKFPIYLPENTNTEPSGGIRQIQYKLIADKNDWLLAIDKVVDYQTIPAQADNNSK